MAKIYRNPIIIIIIIINIHIFSASLGANDNMLTLIKIIVQGKGGQG